MAGVIAVAGATAGRPAAPEQAEADPYDYGYGYEDEAAEDSSPDYGGYGGGQQEGDAGGYDYDAMKDWKPPSQE